MNYPAQPYNELLDAFIQLGGSVAFVGLFDLNANGRQRFFVTQDEGDGYARIDFSSEDEQSGFPGIIFGVNAENFFVNQGSSQLILDRSKVRMSFGSYSIVVQEDAYVVGEPEAFRAAIQSIGAIELNDALVALVSANTGRNPINGEAITYDLTNNKLIWGAPVYDNSLDFSAPFNSMYIPLMFRKF